MYEKAHLILDFKKKSPQVGLEPTKMRQDLKKSVSNLIEREENVLSFGCDFSLSDHVCSCWIEIDLRPRKTWFVGSGTVHLSFHIQF